jgi:ABC-type nitrate/sulfonate/bicarbonate transport system substrate-binding protein
MRFRTPTALILTLAVAGPACADPAKLRVGNSAAQAFSVIPVEAGIREDIFAKNGVAVESIAFGGSGKQHQAMAAGAIDIALSGISNLSYVAKGTPGIGIAEMAGPPLFLGIVAPYNSPLTGPDDGLETIQESFKDLGLLDTVPDMSKLYTEAYLPKDR